jgi:hypothetical protein
MAIQLIQNAVYTAGAQDTPITLAFGNAITAGNLVCGFLCADGLASATPTITDPSNTYTLSSKFTDTTDNQALWAFYKFNVTGGQTVLTFAQTSGHFMSSAILEFSGIATVNALDGSVATGTGLGASGTTTALGAAGDLIVAGCYKANSSASSATGGLTLLDSVANNTYIAADSYLLSASGSTTPGFSWTGSNGWVMAAMAFLPSATPLAGQIWM